MSEFGTEPGKVSGFGEIKKASKINTQDPEATKSSDGIENVSTPLNTAPDPDKVNLEPKISDKPGFNPSSTQDGRVDRKNEGGISKSQSTGITGMSDKDHGSIIEPMVGDIPDKYELTGFTVSYLVPGTRDIQSQEVRTFFDKLDEAKASINGRKYMHKMKNGSIIESDINRGMPSISINDVMKCEYSDETWRRV